jgi:hypothetical protein
MKIGLRNLVAIKLANIFQKVIKILKYSSVPRMLQLGLSKQFVAIPGSLREDQNAKLLQEEQ